MILGVDINVWKMNTHRCTTKMLQCLNVNSKCVCVYKHCVKRKKTFRRWKANSRSQYNRGKISMTANLTRGQSSSRDKTAIWTDRSDEGKEDDDGETAKQAKRMQNPIRRVKQMRVNCERHFGFRERLFWLSDECESVRRRDSRSKRKMAFVTGPQITEDRTSNTVKCIVWDRASDQCREMVITLARNKWFRY